VPAIAGREVDTDVLIAGEDDAADIEHRDFGKKLLIAAQRVGRGRDDRFHVLVELVAIDVAEVAQLRDQEDDAPQESVESPHDLRGRRIGNIPRTDRFSHGLEDAVLAAALRSA
jgi:hypothetical protein